MSAIKSEASAKYSGFKATVIFDGKETPCKVINYSESVKFKDGSVGPAYKILHGVRRLIGGWSCGSERYVTVYSDTPCWVKAERINRIA
jgi:hypothetical protein